MKKIILPFLVSSLLFSGCFYDNYKELYPSISNECDTMNPVTYNKQITSLVMNFCINCHSHNSVNTSPVFLDSYADTRSAAESGRLIGALRHQAGYYPMPKNSPQPLNECLIHEVELWMQNGYPQ